MAQPFRIGTRGSPLAMTQARMVAAALRAAHCWAEDAVQLVPIRTTGDRVQDRPLAEIGGKALWTKELDRALLGDEIDCAVHSLKDVETVRPDTIAIAAVLARADVRDRLIGADTLAALPAGASVGTSSPRRRAQLLHRRPDLRIAMLRGNVETRLGRVTDASFDATLLAAAGLDRLGYHAVGAPVPLATMLPAPAQGAVGIECRADDAATRHRLAAIDDPATHACIRVERALLAALRADCHSPVAALAVVADDEVWLRAELLTEDGDESVAGEARGGIGDPTIGTVLARELLDRAPLAIRRLFGG